MTEVILIRTDYYDEALDVMVRRLQADTSRPVVIMADGQKKDVHYPSDLKVVQVVPDLLNVYSGPNVMWKCGDYTLYAALGAIPEASAFWMIEPDVRIHSDNIKSFFDGLETVEPADFVTAWYTAASPQWAWYPTMSPFSSKIFNCMLQLCRVSTRATRYLFQCRVVLSARFVREDHDAANWPNDEAFVGATLLEGGFNTITFQDHASDFMTQKTFSFTKPTSLKWLERQPKNNRIYHPVVQGPKYVRRIYEYLDERAEPATAEELMQEFGTSILDQVRLESSQIEALTLYNKTKILVSNKLR